jgi:lysophospholipase L1-like esterase
MVALGDSFTEGLDDLRPDGRHRGWADLVAADLVTLSGGGNDIIGFRCDLPALSQMLHEVLAQLAGTGATVVVFTGFDPRGRLPFGRMLAARAASYNEALMSSASQVGAQVVDLWHLAALYRDDMWAPDRLHLSSCGHAVVAAAVLVELDVTTHDQVSVAAAEAAEAARRRWVSARREDATWVRSYFAPWVARQVRGRSAGDLVEPKRAELITLLADPS